MGGILAPYRGLRATIAPRPMLRNGLYGFFGGGQVMYSNGDKLAILKVSGGLTPTPTVRRLMLDNSQEASYARGASPPVRLLGGRSTATLAVLEM